MTFGSGPLPFVVSLAIGLAFGIVYILFGKLSKKLKLNKIINGVFDFFFVILVAFIYFLAQYGTLGGTFRLFTLLALFLGFAIDYLVVFLLRKRRNGERKNKLFHFKRKIRG